MASFPTSVKVFGSPADGPAIHHWGNELDVTDEIAAIETWALATERLLASVPTVDMNTATAVTLYTVPAGKSCIPTKYIIRLASTSLTTVSFSIGWTAAAYNDIVTTALHTELTGNTLYTIIIPIVGAKIGVAAAVMKLLDNILQGGAATVTVDVYGILF